MAQENRPPSLSHILETCLYVRDMDVSVKFYSDIMGLTPKLSSARLTVFPLGNTTLILFQLGQTESDSVTETGTVPGHGPDKDTVALLMDSSGHGNRKRILHTHYCLAVSSPEEVEVWQEHLKSSDVKLRGVMSWERGGKSVYFEDPDGHVGEVGSRGIWEHW